MIRFVLKNNRRKTLDTLDFALQFAAVHSIVFDIDILPSCDLSVTCRNRETAFPADDLFTSFFFNHSVVIKFKRFVFFVKSLDHNETPVYSDLRSRDPYSFPDCFFHVIFKNIVTFTAKFCRNRNLSQDLVILFNIILEKMPFFRIVDVGDLFSSHRSVITSLRGCFFIFDRSGCTRTKRERTKCK